MKYKIEHPKRLIPQNQWGGFYVPDSFSSAPTKRFPNKYVTECGKTLFIDNKGKPYVYHKEDGKVKMNYLPSKKWFFEPTTIPPSRVSKGLKAVKVPKR